MLCFRSVVLLFCYTFVCANDTDLFKTFTRCDDESGWLFVNLESIGVTPHNENTEAIRAASFSCMSSTPTNFYPGSTLELSVYSNVVSSNKSGITILVFEDKAVVPIFSYVYPSNGDIVADWSKILLTFGQQFFGYVTIFGRSQEQDIVLVGSLKYKYDQNQHINNKLPTSSRSCKNGKLCENEKGYEIRSAGKTLENSTTNAIYGTTCNEKDNSINCQIKETEEREVIKDGIEKNCDVDGNCAKDIVLEANEDCMNIICKIKNRIQNSGNPDDDYESDSTGESVNGCEVGDNCVTSYNFEPDNPGETSKSCETDENCNPIKSGGTVKSTEDDIDRWPVWVIVLICVGGATIIALAIFGVYSLGKRAGARRTPPIIEEYIEAPKVIPRVKSSLHDNIQIKFYH